MLIFFLSNKHIYEWSKSNEFKIGKDKYNRIATKFNDSRSKDLKIGKLNLWKHFYLLLKF